MFYRFLSRWPERLEYPSATVVLAVERLKKDETHDFERWALTGRKIGFRTAPLEIVSSTVGSDRLEWMLFNGFFVNPGTPADAVMRRLVGDGFAEASHKQASYH